MEEEAKRSGTINNVDRITDGQLILEQNDKNIELDARRSAFEKTFFRQIMTKIKYECSKVRKLEQLFSMSGVTSRLQ